MSLTKDTTQHRHLLLQDSLILSPGWVCYRILNQPRSQTPGSPSIIIVHTRLPQHPRKDLGIIDVGPDCRSSEKNGVGIHCFDFHRLLISATYTIRQPTYLRTTDPDVGFIIPCGRTSYKTRQNRTQEINNQIFSGHVLCCVQDVTARRQANGRPSNPAAKHPPASHQIPTLEAPLPRLVLFVFVPVEVFGKCAPIPTTTER